MIAERHGSGRGSALSLWKRWKRMEKDCRFHSLTAHNLLFALDLMQGHVYNPEWEQRRSWTNINELQPWMWSNNVSMVMRGFIFS